MEERVDDPRSQGVLLYDGACPFCIAQAERLARWVRGRVRLESFREPGVLMRYPGITRAECEAAIHLVEPDGRVSRGAEAIARTLQLRPALAPIGLLYRVPLLRSLLDWGYALVARNRFQLRRAGGSIGPANAESARATDEPSAHHAHAPRDCTDHACRAHTKAR